MTDMSPSSPSPTKYSRRHPQLHRRTNWKRLGRVQRQVLRLLVYRGPLRTCQLRELIYGRRGEAVGAFEYRRSRGQHRSLPTNATGYGCCGEPTSVYETEGIDARCGKFMSNINGTWTPRRR
jgi:hypothetical protein